MEQDDEDESKDPTDDFGFGISSWMSLLRYLIGLFAVFSVLAVGLGYIYNTNGHFIKGGDQDAMAQWSMGNLGEV